MLRPQGFDWVAQVRLGDELSVLAWGMTGDRFVVGDSWEPHTFSQSRINDSKGWKPPRPIKGCVVG